MSVFEDDAPGLRTSINSLDSQDMADRAQGVDIFDAAPATKLQSRAPIRVASMQEDDTPGPSVQQAGFLFNRGQSGAPQRQYMQDMDCSSGTCVPRGMAAPQVMVSSPAMGQVVESSVAMPAETIGGILSSTLQQQQYDIDPSERENKVPMYTPESQMAAGGKVLDWSMRQLDSRNPIAANQGAQLAEKLFTNVQIQYQDQQTLAMLSARMADAKELVAAATPAGRAKRQMAVLSDESLTPEIRARNYAQDVVTSLGEIPKNAPAGYLESMNSVVSGAYEEGLRMAYGNTVASVYMSNIIDRPQGGTITDQSRREQAEAGRILNLQYMDRLLSDSRAQPENYQSILRDSVGKPMAHALAAFYKEQGIADAELRATVETEKYINSSARDILRSRGSRPAAAAPQPAATSDRAE
jgi:hypothetical protein